ncbi:outer membrane protein OmpA-like peptidoglycan-associated protein [Archangium gephyra]|uniref:Outer membrane protein A n=1 Tax=Archangium gephyra TaxID=48 RepID=A0AAC8Q544_9BACT|nr:OmpA family protein [Archangium gephyra]AKJ01235.1 Outer membrane protein A precursor [Archangium gephyra]REG24455.1 outer membrane protein OmpA-like peptidoglycan-associated protein [Archangium gephyra]
MTKVIPCLIACLGFATAASGFDIHRAQPTPVGESSFMVDSPRFEAGTWSAGLSLDYAYRPLVLGVEEEDGRFQLLQVLIKHQLLGNLELSGSFCDCMTFSASVPLTLLERGSSREASPSMRGLSARATAAEEPLAGIVPVRGLGVSDPRFGLMVRLYGRPGESPFSASLGASVWVPVRKFFENTASHTSDLEARMLSTLVLAGTHQPLRWTFTGAFLLRPEARLGNLPSPEGSSAGSEVQFGASLQYVHPARGFSLGPEARYATLVTPRAYAFKPFFSSLEVLLGLHLRVGQRLRLGVAGGVGLQRQPGTPDFRLFVRMSYDALRKSASVPKPADSPTRPAFPRQELRILLAPPREEPPTVPPLSPEALRASLDHDDDGILDGKDVCPDTALGDTPDPRRLGCPAEDADHDSVFAPEDACPDRPGDPSLEARLNGCPVALVEEREDRLVPQQPIVFAANTDVLLVENLPVLQALAQAIQARPWIQQLRIEGHTDNSGSPDFNRVLSLRRAESVKRWLVEHGIGAALLRTSGHGPSRPITENTTEAGRAANRRVDFIIAERTP